MDETLRKALEALQHAVYLLRKYADAEEMGGSRFDLTDCNEMKPVFAAIAAIEQHKPVAGKYDDVLVPFLCLMERELHANSGKGDRPGWLAMSAEQALLEVYDHAAKLAKAVRNNDGPKIMEHGADVANMAMMVLDICASLAFVDIANRATAAQVTAHKPVVRMLTKEEPIAWLNHYAGKAPVIDSAATAGALWSEPIYPASTVAALQARVAELAKDAERYRWLRDVSVPPHNFYISVPDEFGDTRYLPHEVDEAIDEALRSKK